MTRNQGRPVQGASPWVPATPTGSFPQDGPGQVGRCQDSNALLTNTPDLTCSGRDGPTVPHRGRPRPAPTRQQSVCGASHRRPNPTMRSLLSGGASVSPTTSGGCSPCISATRVPHRELPPPAQPPRCVLGAHDSPMGRGRQHVPKARIQTSETEVGGCPRRPP